MQSLSNVIKLGIRPSLTWLVLGAVTPLLVFGAITAWIVVNQKEAAITDKLAGMASGLTIAVDGELLNQFHSLDILATDASLDKGNLGDFSAHAKRAVAANPTWISIGLIDPASGRILAGWPEAPGPAPLTLAPEPAKEIAKSRKPTIVGAFAQGKLSPGPVILLMVPVIRQDTVIYVLGVAMRPATLNTVLSQGMPSNWTVSTLDAGLIIAGRSRDAQRYVGVPATPSLAVRIQASDHGMFKAITQEGISLQTVFRRSSVTGWTVVIGVPDAEVYGPIRSVLLQLAFASCITLLLAVGVAALVGQGITKRRLEYESSLRKGQLALSDALVRLNRIADSVPGVVYQFQRRPDGSYCFPYASEAIRDIYQVSPDEVRDTADKVFFVLHPDDIAEVARQITLSGDQLSTWNQEYRVRYADGTIRWLQGNALPQQQSDGGVLWHGFITDITGRKMAEAAAAANQQKFERILESAADAIFITNEQGCYQYVNTAAAALLGYSRKELQAMDIMDLTPAEEQEAIAIQFQELVQVGRLRTELKLKRKDGSLVPVGMSATVLPDGSVFGACRDITERSEMEAQVRKLAFYDALTQLPNRRLLLDRMKLAMSASARSGKYGALLFLDLDEAPREICADFLG